MLPLAAVGTIVLAALVGGAVDMSRAYRVQNRLQNACDAAVLAGRRGVVSNGYDTYAKAQAASFFKINFDAAQQGTTETSFTSTSDTKATVISGTATAKVPMTLMQIFGFGNITVSTVCTASMGVGNSDITLVLDTTGSMSSSMLGGTTRIQALRTAMKNFYSTISIATQGTNARVRYAVVPFSTTVRVGQLIRDLNPRYLVDEYAIQSAVPMYNTTQYVLYKKAGKSLISQTLNYSSTPNSSVSLFSVTTYPDGTSCTKALPAPTAWTDTGTPSVQTLTATNNGNGQSYPTSRTTVSQRMTTYTCQAGSSGYQRYWYYKYRTKTDYTYTVAADDTVVSTSRTSAYSHTDYRLALYDVSSFKNFNAVTVPSDDGSNVTSTWAGCIEERVTVPTTNAAYSTTMGMTPSDALDLDIDTPPDVSVDSTKWAPLWPTVAYYRSSMGLATSGSSISSYCPSAAHSLKTMTSAEFGAIADGLTPVGYTYLDIGMVWGGRLSSPDGMWKDIVNEEPSNGGQVNRHLVFMTDGEMQTQRDIQSGWGIEALDRRVTTNGSNSTSDANHSRRYRALCEAIRAKGIRIWAIQFDDTTTVLQADLAACASPNSTYAASNAAQLNAAFQEIAKQVGELRVVS